MRQRVSVWALAASLGLFGLGQAWSQAPAEQPDAPPSEAPPAAGRPKAAQAPQSPPSTNAVITAQVPKLTGALVAKPPQYARWVVRYERVATTETASQESKTPPPPVNPKMIEYIKGPNVGRSVTTWMNGGQTVIWYYENVIMEKFPVEAPICIKELPPDGADNPNEEGYIGIERILKRYPGFSWLRHEHFVGEEMRNNLLCLHFVQKEAPRRTRVRVSAQDAADMEEAEKIAEEEAGKAGEKAPPRRRVNRERREVEIEYEPVDREAWVTVDGRWPVAVRDRDILRTFQHLEAPVPGAFPRMGAEFEALLADYCREWNLPPPKY